MASQQKLLWKPVRAHDSGWHMVSVAETLRVTLSCSRDLFFFAFLHWSSGTDGMMGGAWLLTATGSQILHLRTAKDIPAHALEQQCNLLLLARGADSLPFGVWAKLGDFSVSRNAGSRSVLLDCVAIPGIHFL